MPKQTKKWIGAKASCQSLGIKNLPSDQDKVYSLLAELGLYWDSKIQSWLRPDDEPADDPTPLVFVRLWCDSEIVADAADCLISHLEQAHFRLVERSPTYPCRPPRQREARIYLKFDPPYRIAGHEPQPARPL